jgi:hypothetical protein
MPAAAPPSRHPYTGWTGQRDPQSRQPGARLAKEHKDSRRRIDAAVAAVMAVHRAAELADTTPAIYA